MVCRYYLGRRPIEDRHIAQVRRNCDEGDCTCRRGQRQALLHWAYDSRKL